MADILLPYQKKWVTADHKFCVYTKSRQIGISWAEACWSVRRRLLVKRDHWFVSADETTAKEFVRHCRFWANVFGIVLGEELLDANGTTTQSLTFPNGSRIMALSSNPTATRGKTGDITLDEFAFHQDAEAMYAAAKAVQTWGGQMRVISTENGPSTVFHHLVTGAPANGFALYRTTLVDAINDGLALKIPGDHQKLLPDIAAVNAAYIDGVKRTSFSAAVYEQEYMCGVGDTSGVITAAEYDACVVDQKPVPEHLNPNRKYGPLYLGFDVGRTRNLSVVWVIEEGLDPTAPAHLQRIYRTVAVKEMTALAFGAQQQVVEGFLDHPSMRRACIDQGGIGMQLAEELAAKYGWVVEPFAITGTSKARLVERTKKWVAQARVGLPKDEATKLDVLAMRRGTTKAGNVTYDGTSGQSHCDRLMALALALEAADNSIRLTATSTMTAAAATNGGTNGES